MIKKYEVRTLKRFDLSNEDTVKNLFKKAWRYFESKEKPDDTDMLQVFGNYFNHAAKNFNNFSDYNGSGVLDVAVLYSTGRTFDFDVYLYYWGDVGKGNGTVGCMLHANTLQEEVFTVASEISSQKELAEVIRREFDFYGYLEKSGLSQDDIGDGKFETLRSKYFSNLSLK